MEDRVGGDLLQICLGQNGVLTSALHQYPKNYHQILHPLHPHCHLHQHPGEKLFWIKETYTIIQYEQL